MALCVICLDTLKSPMALPCGHVYCHECIILKIQSDVTHSRTHRCPSCRNPYSITNIDQNAIPGHLRSSVLPALRRIYLDEAQGSPQPPVLTEAEVSTLRAENTILRAYCESWKRRATLHSAVVYGIAKVAREQILAMRAEREQLEQKYQDLNRKYADLEAGTSTSLTSSGGLSPKLRGEKRPRSDSSESGPSGSSLSPSQPPKKKLRSSTRSSNPKRDPAN